MNDERFARVRALLEIERNRALASLRGASADHELIEHKVALDEAIRILALFDAHGIRNSGRVIQIPPNATPSSDYRLVCDNESDDHNLWTEVRVDNEGVRPTGLSLIVEPES